MFDKFDNLAPGNVSPTGSASLAVFRRDPTTGVLGFVEAQPHAGGCRAAAISPDGTHVYAATASAVLVFERAVDDGRLTPQATQEAGMPGLDGLADPRALAISPDGADVYVITGTDAMVTALARDPATGLLSTIDRFAPSSASTASPAWP